MKEFESDCTEFTPVIRECMTRRRSAIPRAEAVAGNGVESGQGEAGPGWPTSAPTGFDEIVYVIDGSGVLRSADGGSVEWARGDSLLVEEDFDGVWVIREQLRKFHAIVQTATAQ